MSISTFPKISDLFRALPPNNGNDFHVSLEFFPPKTDQGVTTLFKTIHSLSELNPLFVDFTWGAGVSTSDLTLDLCKQVIERFNLNPNMHLTCTNMEIEKIVGALSGCSTAGITNIVALRGDPPVGEEQWTATEGGLTCALDLVQYIKKEHGDSFCLSVSGYPEGHPVKMVSVAEQDKHTLSESELKRCSKCVNEDGTIVYSVCKDEDFANEMLYLKQKCDAGADIIITQLFFDTDVFLTFVQECRRIGITIPILPGIMCISNKGGFKRMTKFCKTRVPVDMEAVIDAIENDDEMKAFGVRFGVELCEQLLANGHNLFHFYTLNSAFVTKSIVETLSAKRLLAKVATSNETLENLGDDLKTVFDFKAKISE